jgi:Co/Zn/Cd efflux system component
LLPTTSAATPLRSGAGGGGSAGLGAGAGSSSGGINARAVSLHVYADAFSSACVVAAALARHGLGLRQADALQAGVVALFTLWIAVPLFRATGLLLLQTTPPALRAPLERCRQETLTVGGVLEVLDERFWAQSPSMSVGSLTVRVRGDASEREVLDRVRRIYGRVVSDLCVQVEKDPKLAWLGAEAGGAGPGGAGLGVGAAGAGAGAGAGEVAVGVRVT